MRGKKPPPHYRRIHCNFTISSFFFPSKGFLGFSFLTLLPPTLSFLPLSFFSSPSIMSSTLPDASKVGLPASDATSAAELASLTVRLRAALRQFPDFPSPGILFEDILPIFADPSLHEALIRSLELHVAANYGNQKPDVIVGLEARGFLMGPSLALRLGASFVPVRKQGKLPGPCETQGYEKEYGQDFFQMQADSIKPGQKVLVIDDIIATGMRQGSIGGYFILIAILRWLC